MIQRPNLYDYLKILALLSMIVDHMGYFLFPEEIWFRVVWRIAFPLFLLLVGYNGSYKRRSTLWIVGVGVQLLVWWLRYRWVPLDPMINILLVIALTRVVLWRVTSKSLFVQIIAFILAILLFPYSYTRLDYWTLAFAFWLAGWWIRIYRWFSLFAWSSLLVVYIFFMITYRWFPEHTWIALWLLGALLMILWFFLSKWNLAYYISPRIDKSIIRISTHALRIYVVHGAVLALVQLASL